MSDVPTGTLREDILSEKVMSAILEIKTTVDRTEEIILLVREVEKQLDTVVSIGVGTRCDENAGRAREAAHERGGREDDEADEEDPLAAEDVRGAPAEEEEAAERDRVRGDDPLQPGLGEVQAAPDGRERDVHDRDVEHGHEERDADERQGQPALRVRYRARRGCSLHLNSSSPWVSVHRTETNADPTGRIFTVVEVHPNSRDR